MDNYHQLREDRFYILLSRQLARSISPAEKEELTELVMAFPEFRLKAELFTQMWNDASSHSGDDEIGEAFMRHLLKNKSEFLPVDNISVKKYIGTPSRLQRVKWLISFAIMAMVIITALMVYSPWKGKPGHKEPAAISSIVTRYGNKSKVNLPDGSQVWLNAGSSLDYVSTDFNSTMREVNLSGEAYFDIVPNVSRPFIVHSGNMQIKVLGTTFNVKAYPEEDNMETSLIKGSVEITIKNRPDDIYILRPNEKLVVSNEGMLKKTEGISYKPGLINNGGNIVALKKVDYTAAEKLVYETAWVQNKLVFKSENFARLAIKMERWYGIRIRFRDERKEDLMFTGIFTTETIQQALNAMQVVHAFNYTTEDDTIYIY
jgi:ferric-dicitrate binding protein FerR (iron transport regulator)